MEERDPGRRGAGERERRERRRGDAVEVSAEFSDLGQSKLLVPWPQTYASAPPVRSKRLQFATVHFDH